MEKNAAVRRSSARSITTQQETGQGLNEFFAKIAAQAREVWDNLSRPQRFWAMGLGILALVLLLSIVFFAQRTVWVPLGTFDLQTAGLIRTELDKRGWRIDEQYRLRSDGKLIEVDAQIRNEANIALAEKGLFGNTEKGFTIFEEFDITTTDYEQRLRTIEALKSEMRRMIRQYSQVEDVNITVPHIETENIFIDKEVPQTASVILTLKPGASITSEQIRAIRAIIAGGFAGLQQDRITLTDQHMNPLMPEDEAQGMSTKQARVESETERSLEDSIRKVLGPVLGNDKFTVTVNVEFDWDSVRSNRENYTVPGFDQYKLSEQTEDEKLSGQSMRPGGEPGVSSNTPPVYNSILNGGPIDYQRAEKIVNYLADKTVTERIQSPFVKRVAAAVAIDGMWRESTDTAGQTARTYAARTREEMTQIEALVKSALGDRPDRDLIEVRNVPWDRTREWAMLDKAKAEAEFRRKTLIYSLLATPLIVLMFVLYMAWRRHVRLREEELARQREIERQKRLIEAEKGLAGEISLEDQERQEIHRRATSLARAKPKVVADLLRTWMAEDAPAA